MKKFSTLLSSHIKSVFDKHFMMIVIAIVVAILFLMPQYGKAQIYSENFGTVAGTGGVPLGNATTPAVGTNWTFTGTTMNISIQSASSGYTGASGGAYFGEENSVNYSNTAGTAENTDASTGTFTSTATLHISTTNYTAVSLTYGYRRSSATYNGVVTLAWGTDGTLFPNVITPSEGTAGGWLITSAITLPSNAPNVYIQWSFAKTGATAKGNYKVDDVVITGTSSIPTVSSGGVSTLSGFNYTGAGPSTPSKPLTITGTNLSLPGGSGTITLNAPTDYLVSTTSPGTGGFGTTASLNYTGGTLSAGSPNAWVELKSGLSAGNYNGETIAITGSDAPEVDVTANGIVGNYYWNGGNPQTVPTNGVMAASGSGSWGATTGVWVEPSSTGTTTTWADGYPAIFAGSSPGGSVSLDASRTAASVDFQTDGYNITSPNAAGFTLTAPITLENNVGLTITPFNLLGFIGLTGNVTGGTGSSLNIVGAPSSSTTINPAIINLGLNSNVNVPTINILSSNTGSSNIYGLAGFDAKTSLTAPNTNAPDVITANNIVIQNNVSFTLGCGTSSALTVNAPISGTGNLWLESKSAGGGTGNVLLNEANHYTGNTYLDGSNAAYTAQNTGFQLQLGIDDALPTTTNLILEPVAGEGGSLNLNGFNQHVASITQTVTETAPGTFITNTGSAATLTINGSSINTIAYPIIGGANLSLAFAGSGTTTLTGVNTFTGGLSVGGTSTVIMGNSTALSSTVPVTFTGGTLNTASLTTGTINLGTLNLQGTSTVSSLVLGSNTYTLKFAASAGTPWASGNILQIKGWTGNYDGTNGGTVNTHIYVGADNTGTGLNQTTQLAQIVFIDGAGHSHIANQLGTGELVPNAGAGLTSSITTHNFAAQGVNTAATFPFVVTGSNLDGSNSSKVTVSVTETTNDFMVSTDGGSTWGTSEDITYTGSTLNGSSSNNVLIQFKPLAAGTKSATINITGGGDNTPPSVTVIGDGQSTFTTNGTGGGAWNSTTTWSGNVVPVGSSDIVVIANGDVVTYNGSDHSISSLVVNGTLTFNNNTNSIIAASTTVNGTLSVTSALVTAGLFTSTAVDIASGGAFTNSAGNAAAVAITNFTVGNGGTYTHDATGSVAIGAAADFPGAGAGGTMTFGPSSNVFVTNWAVTGSANSPVALPVFGSVGYFTLNIGHGITYKSGSWGQQASINHVYGNLTIGATGGDTYNFTKSVALAAIQIDGDLDVQGLVGFTNTATTVFPTVTINGSLNVSAGSLDLDGATVAGTETINIGGNLNVSNTGIIMRSGGSTSLATVNFINTPSATHTFSSTATGINGSKVSWSVGTGSNTGNTLTLNSDFIMSGSSTLTVNSGNILSCGTPATIAIGGGSLALAGSLALNSKALTINANSAITGAGTITGSSTASLSILSTSALNTIAFDQTTDPISNALETLTINGTGGTTVLGSKLNIYSDLKVILGMLNLNAKNVVIKSNDAVTASVDQIGGTLSGASNLTVERFIPAGRAWRLLSVPVDAGSTSIHDTWQESTLITSTLPNFASLGFDGPYPTGSVLQTSMETYVPGIGGGTWQDIPSTNATALNSNSTTAAAYAIFIRGDRSDLPPTSVWGSGTSTHAIVLSATGQYYTAGQTTNTTSGQFNLIANPYPSAIDFSTSGFTSGGVAKEFWLWDPKVHPKNADGSTSYGTYELFSQNIIPPATLPYQVPTGNDVNSFPNPTNTVIQSGDAFFVYSPSGGTVTIGESNKATGSFDAFRPAGLVNNTSAQLQTNLYLASGAAQGQVDENFEVYGDTYSEGIDDVDAPKLPNDAENFAILRTGKKLGLESHPLLTAADTIFYNMWNLQQQQYRLEFVPNSLAQPGLTGYLKDKYLGTSTALNLNDTTEVLFSVDSSNAGSYDSSRFMVVFRPATVVPVTFTSVTASPTVSGVEVGWKVASESDITSYTVEHSTDGVSFTNEDTVSATAATIYSWLDASPATGVNYYRIESISTSGDAKYSSTAKATVAEVASIAVYPNPVKGGKVNLKFINQPAGEYTVRILSASGQLLYKAQVSHGGGTEAHPIVIPAVAEGVYRIETISPSVKTYTQKLVVGKSE